LRLINGEVDIPISRGADAIGPEPAVPSTPRTSEYYLGQPQGNIYGAKLVPRQVGLNRLGYCTELPNLFLVGASAGYPSASGVQVHLVCVNCLLTCNDTPLAPLQSRPESY